jgi:hypothetical protein
MKKPGDGKRAGFFILHSLFYLATFPPAQQTVSLRRRNAFALSLKPD